MSADDRRTARAGGRLLGVGALACAACCIGPIVGLVGTIGIATLAGIIAFGVAGIVIGLVAIPVALRRRRRVACAAPTDGPVAFLRRRGAGRT